MISAFISYAHADELLKDRFLVHLAALRREGLIGVWHDRMLRPGEHLNSAIDIELAAADLVILLVSPCFIHSNYCYEKEMQRAFARAKSGQCKVTAVILEPCQWANIPIEGGGRLGDFLAVPRDGKPVTEWPNRNAAFNNVIAAIRELMGAPALPDTSVTNPSAAPTPKQDTILFGEPAPVSGRQSDRTASTGLKLPRRFTDFDRDTFVDDAFEAIALGFKDRLAGLERENEGIKTRFQRVDAHCFMASVYAHGAMVGGAKIFRGGMMRGDNSIHLSYELSAARNGWNEWLSVENDDTRLYFKAGGQAHVMVGDQRDKLDPAGAADFLWSLMISQVRARVR